MWGCHGGGKVEHFPDTEHATRRCPRRQLLDHPDVIPLFALRRDVDGVDGLRRRKKMSAAAVEGLAVIDDAVNWRTEQHRIEAEKRAKK